MTKRLLNFCTALALGFCALLAQAATVTQGNTGTYTFYQGEAAQITLDPNERAQIAVLSSTGAQRFGGNLSNSQAIGPFNAGDVLSITAIAGDVDYSVITSASTSTSSSVVAQAATLKVAPPALDALAGDSFAFNANGGVVGGLTLKRLNGIVTVTGATSHPFYPGALVTVVGTAALSDMVVRTPVLQYLSSSSFTYASPGADGTIAAGAQSISVGAPAVTQSAGFWSHWTRRTGHGHVLVANAGVPGATIANVAFAAQQLLTPYAPTHVIGLGGYNDINASIPVATTVSAWQAAVATAPTALWDIFSTCPWNSGAAAESAAHLRQLQRYYPALKAAFANYANVRVHDCMALLGASDGHAVTGMVKSSDNIHLTARAYDLLVKYLVALGDPQQAGPPLASTALDNLTTDPTGSKNIIDTPLMSGSGGALTNTTGTYPAAVSGSLTGTSATGTSSVATRSDGLGSNWTITYTPGAADWSLRMSMSLPTSRFPSGGLLDQICAKVTTSGMAAGASNLKNLNMTFVWIADGVTYASGAQAMSSDAEASTAYHLQEDFTDATVCLQNIPIPVFVTSITTARLDFTTSHYGSGTAFALTVGRVQATLH